MDYTFDLQVIIDSFPLLLSGIKLTVVCSLVSAILGTTIGTLLALARISNVTILRLLSTIYVEFIRNTPLLVQLYIYYKGLPNLGISLDPVICGIIGLSTYSGAFITEVVRSGMQSIPKEQFEASKSLGFTSVQSLIWIIFPQTIRIIIQPLGSQFANIIKNSSLLYLITVEEVFYVVYKGSSDEFRYLEFFVAGSMIYMTLIGINLLIVNLVEHYLQTPGRR